MKTRKSIWLLVWDLLHENESANLYGFDTEGNDDGFREGTFHDIKISSSEIITETIDA